MEALTEKGSCVFGVVFTLALVLAQGWSSLKVHHLAKGMASTAVRRDCVNLMLTKNSSQWNPLEQGDKQLFWLEGR